jgi:hypothetical protein
MSDMDIANQHLAQALRRFEAALARRLARAPNGAAEQTLARVGGERDDLARDVGALRAECDRLSAALSEAEETNQALRQVTHQVAERLDGSIAELDHLLEG